MWKLLTSWPLYKQSYRPLSVSATLHIEVNMMMVWIVMVAMMVLMTVMMVTMLVAMIRARAHLMTTRPWSLVRTCFSGAKATVYLGNMTNMISHSLQSTS